ncbi:MAG: hypothetical protein EXR41_02310 [Candidatus Methylopumilus sp.]|nr:hypothetical protein [Candidatus Methylopumilus sp.]
MYIGRFAPSPSDSLHFGSLVTAVVNYLDAKHHQGIWKIRMEDLDKPRIIKGADKIILASLPEHGLECDDEVTYQSNRFEIYQSYIATLNKKGHTYFCKCSRKEISDSGIEGIIYPGTCRDKKIDAYTHSALRIKVKNEWTTFNDAIQGRIK